MEIFSPQMIMDFIWGEKTLGIDNESHYYILVLHIHVTKRELGIR